MLGVPTILLPPTKTEEAMRPAEAVGSFHSGATIGLEPALNARQPELSAASRAANGTAAAPGPLGIRWPSLNGRHLRIGLGIALLLAGASIYAPEILYTASSDAIVNARIVTISAPIEGHVAAAPPTEGTVVAANAPLLTIENPTVDRSRLDELESSRDKARNELVGVRRLADVLDQELRSLDQQVAAFKAATVSRLESVAEENRAEAEGLHATAAAAQHEYDRKRLLLSAGIVSAAVLDHVEQSALRTRADAERAALAAKRGAQELASARNGVYVGQDRNDVPYSQQRADEVRMRRAEVEAQAAALAAHLSQFDQQIAAETERTAGLASAELRAPTAGVVWRPHVVASSAVARNAELLTLIDCSSLFVTATFSGRRFDDLRYGEPATVRVIGSDAEYAGTVVDVRAMESADREERFAAPLPKLGARQVLAIIRLDNAQAMASGNYCNVGRKVEVRFTNLGGAARTAASLGGHVQ
jgi:multidrug resistance efflux pump